MEEKTNTREISMKVLWNIFLKGLWVIALVAVLVTVVAFTIIKVTFKPRYKSTADLYLLAETGTESNQNISNDFMLALHLVDDCKYIITSDLVINKTVENLAGKGIDIKPSALKRSIQIETPKEGRFLNVSVQWGDKEQTKIIVDELCDVAILKTNEIMVNKNSGTTGFLNSFSKGTDPIVSNKKGLSTYILIAIVAALLTYIVFIIKYVADDRIRSDEDVKEHLGLSVLGNIPNTEEVTKKKKGYGKYYSSYYGAYGHSSSSENNNEEVK